MPVVGVRVGVGVGRGEVVVAARFKFPWHRFLRLENAYCMSLITKLVPMIVSGHGSAYPQGGAPARPPMLLGAPSP